MTKKLEFAAPVYYCDLKKAMDSCGHPRHNSDNTECHRSPNPDCRKCELRKEFSKFRPELHYRILSEIVYFVGEESA